MKEPIYLHDNWIVRVEESEAAKIPADINFPSQGVSAAVPGTIHTDLLENNMIPDPFFGENELHLQWISKIAWIYEKKIIFSEEADENIHWNLILEGVDTAAEIFLNGIFIGKVENMFLRYNFPLLENLHKGDNLLSIKFTPPLDYAVENKQSIDQFPSARHPDRVFIRKSQYSFGWDWGPSFPTMGIWKPIYIKAEKQGEIDSIYFETIAIKDDAADLLVKTHFHLNGPEKFELNMHISNPEQEYSIKSPVAGSGEVKTEFSISSPKLWWPHGHGAPHLYDLHVQLLDSKGEIVDELMRKVGIRTVKLDLKDKRKNTFRFRINDKPVYLKGANWIPGDAFLPRFGDEKYKKLISMARQADMNVLRVWGGGIYENDVFYEECDKNGIMVWQDFMFACAAYPDDDDFYHIVEKELNQNVSRLQHHPSVVIWCGNNENEWIWYRDTFRPQKEMPGYRLYHQLFPQLMKSLDPSRPYWPGTPFGSEKDPNDPRSGNRHAWEIWSFWIDYTKVTEDKSLFVTEFGFQGPANYHTFGRSMLAEDFHPQSPVFEFHNKQDEGPDRLYRFLSAHLPVKEDMPSFIYLAQLNQAFAMQTTLEYWRNRFPKTNGSIIWQLNDCWPVTSWSLIDSDLLPKLAYFAVKRAFAETHISFYSEDDMLHLRLLSTEKSKARWEVVAIRDGADNVENIGADRLENHQPSQESRTIFSLKQDEISSRDILVATLYDEKKNILSRNYYIAQPWKYLRLPMLNYSSKIMWKSEKPSIRIEAKSPIFFMALTHPQNSFSDNGFIMLPGEVKKLKVVGENFSAYKEKALTITTLNQYLQKEEVMKK